MYLGYNTNGMVHHELGDALRLLAEIGYQGVAITIDVGVLAPFAADVDRQIARVRRLLDQLRMRSVIETGARFLLDPRRKHEPTLVSADPAARARRAAFYRYAIDCAAELGSSCVSLWSGVLRDGASYREGLTRLAAELAEVLRYADQHGVAVGLEPEPGMLIDRMDRYEELLELVPSLRLTLDVGHLYCQGETPVEDVIRRWKGRLVNVHVEDMRRGVHEHLMFGEGEVDVPAVIQALGSSGYQGGVHVELSRHSHEATSAARRAFQTLAPWMAPYRPQDDEPW